MSVDLFGFTQRIIKAIMVLQIMSDCHGAGLRTKGALPASITPVGKHLGQERNTYMLYKCLKMSLGFKVAPSNGRKWGKWALGFCQKQCGTGRIRPFCLLLKVLL